MNPVLADCESLDIRLHVVGDGGTLRVEDPTEAATAELLDRIRAAKPEIINELQSADEYRAAGMVRCDECANLRGDVCRVFSLKHTQYTPLLYQPVQQWRRCEKYRGCRMRR